MFTYSAHAADTKAEEIVTKHLDSIGTAEARAAIKSRVVQGKVRAKMLVGGKGEADGDWGRVSEQHKSNFLMTFGVGERHMERFVFDGEKADFAAGTAAHRRSAFAEFVASQDFIVKEGLLGGELSTAWALQNLDHSRVKLYNMGLKKVDGRELQGIEYHSKDAINMTIKLYFEPETYRHVMTVYSFSGEPQMARVIDQLVNREEVRYTIEERFSDFHADGGITLPRHYDLQFTRELQSGATQAYDWDMTADKVLNNIEVDPGNFHIK
ncbi:MAG: hypothetical protein ABSD64_00955 [Terriglobales bacterium]|jgi:hypothetical protein